MIAQLEADLKEALLSRDKLKVDVLRSIKASLINERIANGSELADEQVIAVLKREAKKRQEAIELYDKAGQTDRSTQEAAELAVISSYLPAQMSEKELIAEVEKAIEQTGASGIKDMGKVMGYLTQKLQGKADNSLLSRLVRDMLGD